MNCKLVGACYGHRLAAESAVECTLYFVPHGYTRSLLTETTVELLYDCHFEYGQVRMMPHVWFRLQETLQIPLFSKKFFFSWEAASTQLVQLAAMEGSVEGGASVRPSMGVVCKCDFCEQLPWSRRSRLVGYAVVVGCRRQSPDVYNSPGGVTDTAHAAKSGRALVKANGEKRRREQERDCEMAELHPKPERVSDGDASGDEMYEVGHPPTTPPSPASLI